MTTATITTTKRAADPYDIYAEAYAAGKAAAEGITPTPMTVGTAKSLFDDSFDTSQPVYYVSEGVCGFAWVNIRPARGPLVAFLKKRGVGYKGYRGGWQVPAWEFGSPRGSQSLERASAAAYAASEVLRQYGINAYVESRMD